MKQRNKKILWAVLIFILLAFIGLTIFTGKQVFNGMTNVTSREETLENKKDFLSDYEDLKKNYEVKEIAIASSQGSYDIPAIYAHKEGNTATVVLAHALGGTKEVNSKLMAMFLDLGYDAISYDQRNSGENPMPYNTFGVLESNDALDVIAYAKELKPDGKLALWGQSYGGITSIIAASKDQGNLDYLILDCPVTDCNYLMYEILNQIEAEEGIPASYMAFAGNIYNFFKLGFSYKEIDGFNWVDDIKVPVLVTYVEGDEVTPVELTKKFYDKIATDKEIYGFDGYKHGQYPFKETAAYKKYVKEFLEKYR